MAPPKASAAGGNEHSNGVVLSASDRFDVLWRALADTLGTAATATLLRRAAQRAIPRCPELASLVITRESLEYRYTVPSEWRRPEPGRPGALAELVRELWVLLVELTGPVIVSRLARIPELREPGLIPEPEEPS